MKKLFLLILWLGILLSFPVKAFAVSDPLSVPNNRIGIHILFPSELQDAAKLINSNDGDWGYVTIPIQAGDKNLKKWQSFMDEAKTLHVIPILRLATEGDYFNTTVWRKPTLADVLDFANFLDSLNWPTKNRYIIVFNEVNRGDEWGGQPNPSEYADILSYSVTAFKAKSPDFYIISAGMDNAAANTNTAMNEYTFYQQMNLAMPGIFNQVDAMASHSYPNPAFTQPPSVHTSESITSFQFERNFIANLGNKTLPVFITETGWSTNEVNPLTAASYYQQALTTVWTDNNIVAITPFLLQAGGGPFTQFSFLNESGQPNPVYNVFHDLPKIKGQPELPPMVLAAKTEQNSLPVENFSKDKTPALVASVSTQAKTVLKWFLHL